MKSKLLLPVLILWMFSACSSAVETPLAPENTPTEPPAPTDTSPPPQPTNSPLPPEPTATSGPILFLDEFEGGIDSAWSLLNEDSDRWQLTPEGWLAITADNPSVIGSEAQIEQINLFVQPAPEGDLVITTRLVSNPDENFQQAGIFLILDGLNYVSILNVFCEFCLPDTGGHGILMEGFKNAEPTAMGRVAPHPSDQTDFYLRLVFSAAENTVTGYYATESRDWQEVGVVEEIPSFSQVGLGAANTPGGEGISEDLLALFDYFEIANQVTPLRTGSRLPEMAFTPKPTLALEPTATFEPTPLPEGVLFRDDFSGTLQPGWEWLNENPDKWSYVDFDGETWLKIIGDKPGGLAEQANTLMRALPEGDFVLTSHVLADPRQNHHQANIFIFEDKSNYIRLNFGFCDHCGLPEGGHGFFMETIIENNPFGDLYALPRDPAATDVYLRLVNQGGSITGYYATEFGDWQRIGAFGNYFDFISVGLGATNSIPQDWEVEDIEAMFDYFEISIPD